MMMQSQKLSRGLIRAKSNYSHLY